jgi:hypothetical protein
MKSLKIIAAVAALAGGSALRAQVGGSTAYNFLDVSTSARVYGLGGVNVSLVDDDLMLTDQNPALLGPEMSKMLSFGYMRYVGGTNFAAAKYAHSAGENAAWAAAINYYGYGSIAATDAAGNVTGKFSPQDVAFSGVYSRNLGDKWRGAFAIKAIYSGYDAYTAWALCTDLGVNYYDEERDASLSLVVANLGGQVKRFAETYDRLPVDIRLGWSKGLGSTPVTLNVTAYDLTRWKLPYYDVGDGTSDPVLKDGFASNLFRHLVFGVEWRPRDSFYVDLAYNYRTRTDMSTYQRSLLSGFSAGLGLKTRLFSFGVALAQPHTGATTFMLNVTTNLFEL